MSMSSTSVIIGGDLSPTESNFSQFSSGNIGELVQTQLLEVLSAASFRIFNLEVPLTDRTTPIAKDGPSLRAPETTVKGIKALDPSLLSLANNHIADQGERGISDTMSVLSQSQINHIGCGMNLAAASEPFILEHEGLRIGVYSCAEHEFSIAGEYHAGANPLDLLESFDHITSLKSGCDYVIVLHHGGKEYYRYPSPELRRICRKMVTSGADLVICQHSHCIGSYDRFTHGAIVYGQGNFLFDRHDNEFWNTGLLIKAGFSDRMELDFIPVCKRGNGVELADQQRKAAILSGFFIRSEDIGTNGFIEEQYDKYCLANGQYYLATMAGFGTTLRRTDKLLNRLFTRMIYSERKLHIIQNHLECETHRELIINYLRTIGKKH